MDPPYRIRYYYWITIIVKLGLMGSDGIMYYCGGTSRDNGTNDILVNGFKCERGTTIERQIRNSKQRYRIGVVSSSSCTLKCLLKQKKSAQRRTIRNSKGSQLLTSRRFPRPDTIPRRSRPK